MTTIATPVSAHAVPYQASPRGLAFAVGGAVVVAGLLLVLFVLPAERQIDPTGIGRVLGLTQMRSAPEEAVPAPAPAASGAFAIPPQTKQSIVQATPYRSDELVVVLKPHSGTEIKAMMKEGDHLVFRWESTGPVMMDMHGEKPNAADGEFTRYWKEADMTQAQGSMTAAFDGRHGWYFRNRSEQEITVKVRTDGFYASLFQPQH